VHEARVSKRHSSAPPASKSTGAKGSGLAPWQTMARHGGAPPQDSENPKFTNVGLVIKPRGLPHRNDWLGAPSAPKPHVGPRTAGSSCILCSCNLGLARSFGSRLPKTAKATHSQQRLTLVTHFTHRPEAVYFWFRSSFVLRIIHHCDERSNGRPEAVVASPQTAFNYGRATGRRHPSTGCFLIYINARSSSTTTIRFPTEDRIQDLFTT